MAGSLELDDRGDPKRVQAGSSGGLESDGYQCSRMRAGAVGRRLRQLCTNAGMGGEQGGCELFRLGVRNEELMDVSRLGLRQLRAAGAFDVTTPAWLQLFRLSSPPANRRPG